MAKILIAEDDQDLRRIIHDLLVACGFEAREAVDGKDALIKVEQEKPDLVVLDLAMPEIDGWHVAKTLRQGASTRHLPIVALTAHAMADDSEKALNAGCDSYLAKPFSLAALLAEINRLLSQPPRA